MAIVTQEMRRQRFEHKMESVSSESKHFPALAAEQKIVYHEQNGWELVSVVCNPGNADIGICTAILFFKRPVAAPFSQTVHNQEVRDISAMRGM